MYSGTAHSPRHAAVHIPRGIKRHAARRGCPAPPRPACHGRPSAQARIPACSACAGWGGAGRHPAPSPSQYKIPARAIGSAAPRPAPPACHPALRRTGGARRHCGRSCRPGPRFPSPARPPAAPGPRSTCSRATRAYLHTRAAARTAYLVSRGVADARVSLRGSDGDTPLLRAPGPRSRWADLSGPQNRITWRGPRARTEPSVKKEFHFLAKTL